MLSISGSGQYMQKRVRGIPSIIDLDVRFRMMDKFPDYFQVISLAAPPIEMMGEPPLTVELARLANDGMAELVAKHPDRFAGFVASLPMNDIEASLAEIDRAILRLGATGIQIFKPARLPCKRIIAPVIFAHAVPISPVGERAAEHLDPGMLIGRDSLCGELSPQPIGFFGQDYAQAVSSGRQRRRASAGTATDNGHVASQFPRRREAL